MTTDTARAAEQRRFVAARQLETGYEFDTSPNLLATLGPGEPARRSLAQLEAIIAGQPTDSLCGETKIPAAPRESRETKIAAAQGETKNTLPRETISQAEAMAGTETIIEPSRGTISEATSARPMDGTISERSERGTISASQTVGTISERRGRPRKGAEAGTITAMKPWQAEGLSRRTWYRRRKTADTAEHAAVAR